MQPFIIQNINNNALSFPKAMPLKDSTSDGTSSFQSGRRVYMNMFSNPITTIQQANKKKWLGGNNRDASQIVANRRNTEIGKGTINVNVSNSNSAQSLLVGGGIFSNGISWSNDGIIWYNPEINNIDAYVSDVIWTGTRWLATCANNNYVIATSDDGKNWQPNENSGGLFEIALAVGTNGNNIVVMGENNDNNNINNTLIHSTDNGTTWSPVQDSSGIFTNTISLIGIKLKGSVLWNGSVWVGTGSGPNSLGYSSDPTGGSMWQGAISSVNSIRDTSSTLFQIGTSIVNNGEFCVAGGFSIDENIIVEGPSGIIPSCLIAWSNDGIVWNPANLYNEDSSPINDINNITNSILTSDIGFNGKQWIATGVFFTEGLVGYSAISNDGQNWTLSNSIIDNVFPLSVVWNGSSWVLSGFNENFGEAILLYSTNGLTWNTNSNATGTPFLNMTWNGKMDPSSSQTLSFTNGKDINSIQRALHRVRSGGSVAPLKKNANLKNAPTPSFAPAGPLKNIYGLKSPVLFH